MQASKADPRLLALLRAGSPCSGQGRGFAYGDRRLAKVGRGCPVDTMRSNCPGAGTLHQHLAGLPRAAGEPVARTSDSSMLPMTPVAPMVASHCRCSRRTCARPAGAFSSRMTTRAAAHAVRYDPVQQRGVHHHIDLLDYQRVLRSPISCGRNSLAAFLMDQPPCRSTRPMQLERKL